MLDDGKLGTVLTAAAVVFVVFFIVFLWLFGWGFYISSALGAAAAVTVIWWMGVEDAEMVEDPPGTGRVTSRPLAPASASDQDNSVGTTTPVEAVDLEETSEKPPTPEEDAMAAAVPVDEAQTTKPAMLDAPDGEADDLTKIKGIGPKLRDMLNDMGVWHFSQIAAWSDAELDWIDEHLEGFKGRARRDEWVAQAGDLS